DLLAELLVIVHRLFLLGAECFKLALAFLQDVGGSLCQSDGSVCGPSVGGSRRAGEEPERQHRRARQNMSWRGNRHPGSGCPESGVKISCFALQMGPFH